MKGAFRLSQNTTFLEAAFLMKMVLVIEIVSDRSAQSTRDARRRAMSEEGTTLGVDCARALARSNASESHHPKDGTGVVETLEEAASLEAGEILIAPKSIARIQPLICVTPS